MDEKITAARQKLQAALIAGEPTDGLRSQLAALEADQQASSVKVEVQAEKAEARQTKALEKRAAQIATEANAAIEATLQQHPIPEYCQL